MTCFVKIKDEMKKGKNSVGNYKRKTFNRKSNSLKVFHKESKKSTRTLKNVLSEKNMNNNNNYTKKSKNVVSSKKEKKKSVSKYNVSTKSKSLSKKGVENKENNTTTSKSNL